MSTSPSWFDQEKFSRLVKKVGPKGAASPLPATSGRAITPRPPEKETRRLQRSLGDVERAAEDESNIPPPPAARSSGPISVPEGPIRAEAPEAETKESEPASSHFPPPMPVPEPRSVSPLAKRTTPLPDLKSIFEYESKVERPTSQSQPLPGRPHLTPAPIVFDDEVEPEGSAKAPSASDSSAESAGSSELPEQPEFPGLREAPEVANFPSPWQAFTPLVEEPAPPESSEVESAPDELDELFKERAELMAKVEELSRSAQERDSARAEADLLRHQLQQADEILQATRIPDAQPEEFTRTLEERDSARRDYANLREEYEKLKREQGGRRGAFAKETPRFGQTEESSKSSATSGSEEEVAGLKAQVSGLEITLANLKKEMDAVQGQIAQSKDDTSVAQRGLALSQRALQETREALRQALDTSSQTKANVESLKNECSSLVQQNLGLQSQNDQLSRELASVRTKLVARG